MFRKPTTLPTGQGWLIERMQALGYPADKQGVCQGVSYVSALSFLASGYDLCVSLVPRPLKNTLLITQEGLYEYDHLATEKILLNDKDLHDLIKRLELEQPLRLPSYLKSDQVISIKEDLLPQELDRLNIALKRLRAHSIVDEHSVFEQLLAVLNSIDPKNLPRYIALAQKSVRAFSQEFIKNTEQEIEREKHVPLATYVSQLGKEEKEDFFREFFDKKNAYIEKMMEAQYANNLQILKGMKLLSLVEEIEFAFHYRRHAPIFEKEIYQSIKKNEEAMLELIMPWLLEERGGIYKSSEISSIYTQAELALFFELMVKKLQSQGGALPKISLYMVDLSHAIHVGFQPVTNTDPSSYAFRIIDPNNLADQQLYHSPKAIAHKVVSAFSTNGQAEIEIKIMCRKEDQEKLQLALTALNADEDWQKLHAVTAEKAQRMSSKSGNWLGLAVASSDESLVRSLLAAGADPNITTSIGPALTIAVRVRDEKIFDLILANTKDVNATTPDGITPLYIAVSEDLFTMAKLLLEKGANANVGDNDSTPLILAADAGSADMVRLLIQHGADINFAIKDSGLTALFIAAQNGHQPVVELLLAHGANPEANFKIERKELLTFGQENNCLPAVSSFIEKKPDTSTFSLTPQDIAEMMGHQPIVALLTHKPLSLKSS